MTKQKLNILGDCCKVQAVVSVDERGQMVLPKEIREKAGIKAGDNNRREFYESIKICGAGLVGGMLGAGFTNLSENLTYKGLEWFMVLLFISILFIMVILKVTKHQ